ncbi:hypothetical protein FRB94_008369 [Tulasnella sp. JGI-2019a]|nr:hypothetical protein FRB94_008369 [Tulasnella sp. JGI-2019a]
MSLTYIVGTPATNEIPSLQSKILATWRQTDDRSTLLKYIRYHLVRQDHESWDIIEQLEQQFEGPNWKASETLPQVTQQIKDEMNSWWSRLSTVRELWLISVLKLTPKRRFLHNRFGVVFPTDLVDLVCGSFTPHQQDTIVQFFIQLDLDANGKRPEYYQDALPNVATLLGLNRFNTPDQRLEAYTRLSDDERVAVRKELMLDGWKGTGSVIQHYPYKLHEAVGMSKMIAIESTRHSILPSVAGLESLRARVAELVWTDTEKFIMWGLALVMNKRWDEFRVNVINDIAFDG